MCLSAVQIRTKAYHCAAVSIAAQGPGVANASESLKNAATLMHISCGRTTVCHSRAALLRIEGRDETAPNGGGPVRNNPDCSLPLMTNQLSRSIMTLPCPIRCFVFTLFSVTHLRFYFYYT